jgi:hypothetical protein
MHSSITRTPPCFLDRRPIVRAGQPTFGVGERLSERCAQDHVQYILTKLDLPNRSRIAVWITNRT